MNEKTLKILRLFFIPLVIFSIGGYYVLQTEESNEPLKDEDFFKADSLMVEKISTERERQKLKLESIKKKKEEYNKIQSSDEFWSNDIKPSVEEKVVDIPLEKPKVKEVVKIIYKPQKTQKKQEVIIKPTISRREGNPFYSATSSVSPNITTQEEGITEGEKSISFKVVIHGNHEVKNGDRITLRTTQSVIIDGINVPKNSYFYGFCAFENNRILINLNIIKRGDRRLVIRSYKAYDIADGERGIYTPSEFTQEAGNDVTNEVIDEVSSGINVPIIGVLPKELLKRKVREPTRILKDGSPLIIRKIL